MSASLGCCRKPYELTVPRIVEVPNAPAIPTRNDNTAPSTREGNISNKMGLGTRRPTCGCKDNDDGRGYEGYARMSEQLPLPNTNPKGKAKARVMKGRKTNPPIIISGLSLTIPKARRTAAMKIRPTKLYVMCVNCQSS